MKNKQKQIINSLFDREHAFSTIACNDTVSLESLQEKDYFFWMVGPDLKAGSIVAIYTPKCLKSKFNKFPPNERGKINYLFSCARKSYRPASKKFSTSKSRNIVFLFNRIKLDNGITLNQLKTSELNYYSKNIYRFGRMANALTREEVNVFWNLVIDNNPNVINEIENKLLCAPKFPKVYHPKNIDSYKYQIIISNASEDNQFAKEFYKACLSEGISTYYYKSKLLNGIVQKESGLQGKNGNRIFREIKQLFQKDSFFFVPIISRNYKKTWTERELAFFQEKFVSSYEYMIPIRLDDSEIPGLEGDIKYYSLRQMNLSEIVNKIKVKIGRAKLK